MSEERDNKKIDVGTPRQGWEAVRDYMERHDKKMIDDFNDDINTLLVFAGLFSAVVTAFVLEFYKMLQEDFTQTSTQLLSQISGQLASFSINGSYINSTAQAASTVRIPPTSAAAVCVNTLWFLSLVLSLAAALFGMVTKQWLREYDQWTNSSLSLQDIIHLRQMRYDAFIRWKVPTVIAAMPAMLEFALILFLVGMIVLLWTVNGAIAGILTAVVAVLVVLSAATTFLPVFFPRCPYKSPVCWAFMRLGWFCIHQMSLAMSKAYRATPYRFRKLRRFLDNLSYTLKPSGHETWRARDHSNHPLNSIAVIDVPRFHYPGLNQEAAQLVSLIRGLGWIHDTSQDTRFLESVNACWQTSSFRRDSHVLIFAAFHIACYVLHIKPGVMSERLDAVCCVETENERTVRSIYLGTQEMPWIGGPGGIWDSAIQGQNAQLTGFLAHAFKRFMDDFHFFLRIADLSAEDQLTVIRMALRVLTLSLLLPKQYSAVLDRQPSDHDVIAIFHQLTMDEEACSRLPGARRLIIDCLGWCEDPCLSLLTSRIGGRVPEDAPYFTIRAILAIHLYDSEGTPNFKRRESCDLFVHVAYVALGALLSRADYPRRDRGGVDSESDEEVIRMTTTLFEHMAACVRYSVSQRWSNCGSYTRMPWLEPLCDLFRNDTHFSIVQCPLPYALVRALALCRDEGLITADLDELHGLLAKRSTGRTANGSASNLTRRPPSPSSSLDTIRIYRISELEHELEANAATRDGGDRVSRSGFLNFLSGRKVARDGPSPSTSQTQQESPTDARPESSNWMRLLSLRKPKVPSKVSSSRGHLLVRHSAPLLSSSPQTDQVQVGRAAITAHPAAGSGALSQHDPSQTASAGLQGHAAEEHPPTDAPAMSLLSPSLQTDGLEAETTVAFLEPSEQSPTEPGPSSSSDNFDKAPAKPEPEDTSNSDDPSVDSPLGAPIQGAGFRLEIDRTGGCWSAAEAPSSPLHASRTYEAGSWGV